MSKKFCPTRQKYWGEEEPYMVEICSGGFEHANPDMMGKYPFPGEMDEYTDPREAVKVGLEIQKLWRKACPGLTINISGGDTGGNTLPFSPMTKEEITKWGDVWFERLEKCEQCGEILDEVYEEYDMKFCSESCVDQSRADSEEFDKEYDNEP